MCTYIIFTRRFSWPPVRWRPRSGSHWFGLQPVPPQHLGQTFRVRVVASSCAGGVRRRVWYDAGRSTDRCGQAGARRGVLTASTKTFPWNHWKRAAVADWVFSLAFLQHTRRACRRRYCWFFTRFASAWINFTYDYFGRSRDGGHFIVHKYNTKFTIIITF